MSVEPAPSLGRLTLAELPDPGTATGLSNRPQHLSHSAASQWRKCGAQYAWLKDHPGGDRSTPATIRGQIAHGALEAAYSVVPPTCADDLLACLPAAIERFQREHESAPAFMALDNGERAAIVADAAECLNRLWEIDPHPIGPDITIVGTEVKVEALVGGVPFVAHVDLAYRTAGGELVLVDWKTGDQPSPRYQNDVTTQLLLNAGVWYNEQRELPGWITAVWLGKKFGSMTLPVDPRLVRVEVARMQEAWNGIASNSFTTDPGPLCSWCPAAGLCPDGRAAIRSRAENPDKSLGPYAATALRLG